MLHAPGGHGFSGFSGGFGGGGWFIDEDINPICRIYMLRQGIAQARTFLDEMAQGVIMGRAGWTQQTAGGPSSPRGNVHGYVRNDQLHIDCHDTHSVTG